MKNIFKHISVLLSVALVASFAACTPEEPEGPEDLGLGIKVFFPTKVIANTPMTINGSGFAAVTEIEFPEGVKVTNFEIVSDEMIRVTAPSGIAAEGGYLVVRTASESAESEQKLTIGHPTITGYNRQEGETVKGGEQLIIYGQDLEFLESVEILDPDGNPLIISDEAFYRKGTNTVIILLPNKIYEGTYAGKITTFDGTETIMPEFAYEPGSQGGHWETVKTVIWENPGAGAVSWNGTYRFAKDGNDGNNECIATFSESDWMAMKTGTFYVLIDGADPQIRVTDGWWSTTWTGDDIFPGNELLTDNGDGTYTLAITLAGDPLLDVIDSQHLLLTGDRYTPLQIFFQEEVWVEGEEGHWETVISSAWKNDGSVGAANWNATYRFALEGHDGLNECVAQIAPDLWEAMKTGPFYVKVTPDADWFQIRVVTGWWTEQYPVSDDSGAADFNVNSPEMTDNGDGTYTLCLTFGDHPIVGTMDERHLLFTGSGFIIQEIYLQEEVWVDGGSSSGPKEVVFWENPGAGAISWSSAYRFALDGNDGLGECIATFPEDVWSIIKTGTFYMLGQGNDNMMAEGNGPQVRVTDGWWTATWTGNDIFLGNPAIISFDESANTFVLEIHLEGDPLLDVIDVQHLLLTGDRYTPLKLYYLQ